MRTTKETMYERVAPMVDEMRAKYPIDLSGLEPALTQDIAGICLRVLDDYKHGRFVLIDGNDVNK
jgi:phosphatidylserine/phosphatidylglycerophosphate/cardiolipin synthase-like enzyme